MEKVKIGGVTYSIEIVPLVVVDGNRNCQGSVDHNKTEILLLDTISEERRNEVLIHEITHAIAHESNIDVSEESVLQFSKVLLQVIQDNDFDFLKRDKDETIVDAEFLDRLDKALIKNNGVIRI